ncbi:hypothetical protein SCANM124S_05492 [Streptomyces canus]
MKLVDAPDRPATRGPGVTRGPSSSYEIQPHLIERYLIQPYLIEPYLIQPT